MKSRFSESSGAIVVVSGFEGTIEYFPSMVVTLRTMPKRQMEMLHFAMSVLGEIQAGREIKIEIFYSTMLFSQMAKFNIRTEFG